ncbi:MAG: class I SAM-dependent RNA methyltransferase [Propionibacterium sp.]|jgi:SAM-dependent methyltransferase related to tRNA|nr:class I SAM-dependent RNA methyltransferase [Propionibacterium sp.]
MKEVELERVAHGGVVVGRADGKVVFVTGGLPGERVAVEITEQGKRFDRGRVVRVLRPSPGRVEPPCPIAGKCGGCDWQHASHELQLDLKTAIVAEQLSRLAGIAWDGRVEAVQPTTGWRTRMRYATRGSQVGLRGRRSHEVVPLPPEGCLMAVPGPSPAQLCELGAGAQSLSVIHASDGISVLADGRVLAGSSWVHEQVGPFSFQVAASGFWQVHPRAAEILLAAVIEGLRPQSGESALDLYCGSGLFAAGLDQAGARVFGVELNRQAVANARLNVPRGRFLALPLERALHRLPSEVDLVVLDPPRRGAGAAIVARVADLAPRAIAYVACDPASLARDVAGFALHGYQLRWIRAFDLFPMTHHVECVAVLEPAADS